jgi:hypothetical protein
MIHGLAETELSAVGRGGGAISGNEGGCYTKKIFFFIFVKKIKAFYF